MIFVSDLTKVKLNQGHYQINTSTLGALFMVEAWSCSTTTHDFAHDMFFIIIGAEEHR